MNYLFLTNFNGGSIFKYLNIIEPNFITFEDINIKKKIYEKKFIFLNNRFKFLNFIEFPDFLMIIFFVIKEFFFFFIYFIKRFLFKKKKKNFFSKFFLKKKKFF